MILLMKWENINIIYKCKDVKECSRLINWNISIKNKIKDYQMLKLLKNQYNMLKNKHNNVKKLLLEIVIHNLYRITEVVWKIKLNHQMIN